jgi:PAS domain S-box-containing protein
VDLSPDNRYMERLRAIAPPLVSLFSSDSMLRFCAAIDDGRLRVGIPGSAGRKSQKLFALLVDQVDGDILILDESGIILDANRHAAESCGLKPADLVGKRSAELSQKCGFCFHDEQHCSFQGARATGKQTEHTFTYVLPDGRARDVRNICYPVADAFGSPNLYLYWQRDITERHQMEQRLQQSEKMAAIGELSTYMAHEIRNPLFSIGGFANSLLRNPSLNEFAREKAGIIYDESRRLDAILTSILNFARPTQQAIGIFDAATVARQTVDLMCIGSEERGITVKVEIAEGLPKVSGNAENLKQCLINLVKNSLEAMPSGGALTVRARQEGPYVRLEVEDTGAGIAPDVQEKVFSPFYTTKHGGAGLGLAMTKKVIEEMRGKVELESALGRGSRISLLVPVALAVEEEGEAAAPPAAL